MSNTIELVCQECNNPYPKELKAASRSKFCTKTCQAVNLNRIRWEGVPKKWQICETCGQILEGTPASVKRKKYCRNGICKAIGLCKNRSPLSKEAIEQLVELRKNGNSSNDIAESLDISLQQVKQILNCFGLYGTRNKRNHYRWNAYEIEKRCEICGYDLDIERAHIVAATEGGPDMLDNMLVLCPNHHTALDKKHLLLADMEKIQDKVAVAVAKYKKGD